MGLRFLASLAVFLAVFSQPAIAFHGQARGIETLDYTTLQAKTATGCHDHSSVSVAMDAGLVVSPYNRAPMQCPVSHSGNCLMAHGGECTSFSFILQNPATGAGKARRNTFPVNHTQLIRGLAVFDHLRPPISLS